jgi:hypothetical protein
LSAPSFSPDGQTVVFSHSGGDSAADGLYTTALDGTNVKRLTTGRDSLPIWQPITAASLPTTTTTTTSTTTSTTVVAGTAPTPIITLAISGRTLQVTGVRSTDDDGTIVSYQWLWGDKTIGATARAATHTYAYARSYRVQLTVTDNTAKRTTTEVWVHVS